MDFFEHQEKAHSKTKLLLFYFVLAVMCIVIAIYAIAVVSWGLATENNGVVIFNWWNPTLLLYTTLAVLGIISFGAGYKIIDLQEGGRVIASALGGKEINLNTTDPDERKLLNIVEEMSIASGTPVPSVFLLDDELSINAFAAGHTISDAVIGVTRGSIKNLNREELQGVIAHEFSHIFNGDMRLNIRLMGILHGILCIAVIGYYVFRSVVETRHSSSSSRGKGGGAIPIILLVGIALMAIGYIGVFFAKLIKSAVSRQREFLADASAVQFTRNPGGIVNALKKIGGIAYGSRIQSPHAEEASHFFFADGLRHHFFNLLATHPPLEERIQTIDPTFDGQIPVYIAKEFEKSPVEKGEKSFSTQTRPPVAPKIPHPPIMPPPPLQNLPLEAALGLGIAAAGTPSSFSSNHLLESTGKLQQSNIYHAQALHASLPEKLKEVTREPFGARALIYALLLSRDTNLRSDQLQQLEKSCDPGILSELKNILPILDKLSLQLRIPLIDLAIPALRQLSKQQYEIFSQQIKNLIEADHAVDLFEYTLKKILFRHLDIYFGVTPHSHIRFQSLRQILPDCIVVLSILANLHTEESARTQAFSKGINHLNISISPLPSCLPAEKATLAAFDTALTQIADAAPVLKRNILYACASTVTSDQVISPEEAELLRAIADSLDCPIPPFVQEIQAKE